MTRDDSCQLLTILAEIDDPRNSKGKRHPLNSMLALVVIGILCGHKGYTSIATWAREQPELKKALGFTHKNTPCAATFHLLFKKIDVDALEATLTKWVNTVTQDRPDLNTCFDAVAIDGKTLVASAKQEATTKHLLSVVSHELGVTLTQCAVSDKTNEIPVSTQILEAFDVKGKVVTTDALLTQRAFCQKVVDAEGDYLLPVKKNQAALYEEIQTLFQYHQNNCSDDTTTPDPKTQPCLFDEPITVHQTVEKAHGRLETRVLKAGTQLNEYLDWPGIAQVIEYRYTYKDMRTGKETENIQYGITSLHPSKASAERLLSLRRGHGSIENKSHWVRDTVLGEDASPVRCGAIPQVMAALRNTALSVLRFAGYNTISDAIRYFASRPKLAVNLIK